MQWTPRFQVGPSRKKFRVWGYFENLFLTVPTFDLGDNFRLRRILESERRELYAWDGRVPDQGIPLADIDSLSVVAETTLVLEYPQLLLPHLSASAPIATIQSISRALVLFFGYIVKVKTTEPQPGDFPELTEFANATQPRWTQSLFTKYRNGLLLNGRDLDEFKEFFRDYTTYEKPGFLWRAIGRLGMASDMAGELQNMDYRFVDYIRSLEALLGGGTEIAHTLAARTSALVGGSHNERLDTNDFVKAAYRCRSGSVHGDVLAPLAFRRWAGTIRGLGLMEVIDILHWYCRLSVKRVIDLISAVNKSETLAPKWKSMSDQDQKHWVTELLDYSLLRSDLAEVLQSFFAKTQNIDTLWAKYEQILGTPYTHPLMYDGQVAGRD